MRIKGSVVVVTGGGTGIGRATAQLFAKKKARVVVCGRRPEPLEKTVQLIKQSGGAALAIPTDVRSWEQVVRMVDVTAQQYGKIDVLVNNAGIAIAKSLVDTTEREWDAIINTNLKGIFFCCKAVLPKMLEAKSGYIINISSIYGQNGVANFTAYCASKFGVIGLTQAMAKEISIEAIKAFAVCPGACCTDLNKEMASEEIVKQFMPPEKVAVKIIELVTGEIPLSSGENIVVNEQPLPFTARKRPDGWKRLARLWLRPILLRIKKHK